MVKTEKKEIRIYQTSKVEIRADESGKKKICGYAARFNSFSEVFYDSWVERIMPGAFDEALKVSDVRGLFNHDSNIVLGRQSAGTLNLIVDTQGLYFEIDPADTQSTRDLMTSIDRKDIDGCSFAFIAKDTKWEELEIDGRMLSVRNIISFEQIYDVGPVTYPAYLATDVGCRSMDDILSEKPKPEPKVVTYRTEILKMRQKMKECE